MTTSAIKATKGTDFAGGITSFLANPSGSGADATTVVADIATLTTNIATLKGAHLTTLSAAVSTLVADGVTPTQAHVTTLNTAFGVTNTDIAAVSAVTATADATALQTALAADVLIVFDTSKITTRTQLKHALDKVLQAAAGGGILTP